MMIFNNSKDSDSVGIPDMMRVVLFQSETQAVRDTSIRIVGEERC